MKEFDLRTNDHAYTTDLVVGFEFSSATGYQMKNTYMRLVPNAQSKFAIGFMFRITPYISETQNEAPVPIVAYFGSTNGVSAHHFTVNRSDFSNISNATLDKFFGSGNNSERVYISFDPSKNSQYYNSTDNYPNKHNAVDPTQSNAFPIYRDGRLLGTNRQLSITPKEWGTFLLTSAFCEYFGLDNNYASDFATLGALALPDSSHFKSQTNENKEWYIQDYNDGGGSVFRYTDGNNHNIGGTAMQRETTKASSLLFANADNAYNTYYYNAPNGWGKMCEIAKELIWCAMYAEDKKKLKYLTNYYVGKEYDPINFSYNATVDEKRGLVDLTISKNFSGFPLGGVYNIENFKLGGVPIEVLGAELTGHYEFYIKLPDKPDKYIIGELLETMDTGDYRYKFPVYQLLGSSEDLKEYLKNPQGFVTKFFSNNLCFRAWLSGRDSADFGTLHNITICDTQNGDTPITYGYSIPISHSDEGESLKVVHNDSHYDGSGSVGFVAWLEYLKLFIVNPLDILEIDSIVSALGYGNLNPDSVWGVEDMELTYIDIETTPDPIDPYDYDTAPNLDEDEKTPEPTPEDPDPIGGEIPEPIPPQPIPNRKTVTGRALSLYTVYKDLTGASISALANYLWSGIESGLDLDLLKKVQNNPIENIISLKLSPFSLETSGENTIKLGNVDTGISALVVNSSLEQTIGTFNIPQRYGNFLDLTPFTSYELYLPFVGYVEMDSTYILNEEIQLKVFVDMLTLIGKYQLIRTSDNMIVGEYEFNSGAELPISASNNAQAMANLIGSLATTGFSALTGNLSGVVGGLASAVNTQYHTSTSGRPTPNTSHLTNRTAYYRITRPSYEKVAQFNHTIGRLSYKTMALSELEGFTKLAPEPDLSGIPCTAEEMRELAEVLTNGFYI